MATLSQLLEALRCADGSDLHLCAGAACGLHGSGELRFLSDRPLSHEQCAALIREAIGDAAVEELQESEDVEVCQSFGALGRFRFSVYLTHLGMAAVVRSIPEVVPTPDQLGLPQSVASFSTLRRGLVLLAGASGSGKTTTLAAIINLINHSRSCQIITIEKPIEHLHPSVQSIVAQREVGRHTSSFARGVATALRKGADVIALGDLSEPGSVQVAVEAANRGHLVLAAVCATSAVEAIERALEAWAPGEQPRARSRLAANLQGVVVQTLVRRKDKVGRTPAAEVLLNVGNMPSLLREGKLQQAQATIQAGARVGMSTLNDSLVRLVTEDIIHSTEALTASLDRDGLLRGLQSAGVELEMLAMAGIGT